MQDLEFETNTSMATRPTRPALNLAGESRSYWVQGRGQGNPNF
jgi:hypothetical protein